MRREHEPARDQPQLPPARKVLIVDDNHDVAEVTSLLLQSAGCEVQVAFDGATAIETAAAFQPEIVFMDLGMPVLDGYETCRRIRAAAWGKSMQMIAVSGWDRPEDRHASATAGFDRHLVKPVNPEILLEIVGPDRQF